MKSYTIYSAHVSNINNILAQVRKVAPVTAMYQSVSGIGMNVITVYSPKIRDWVMSILYTRNITMYKYRNISLHEREYTAMTVDDMAEHLKKFTVCKSCKGKYYVREVKPISV